MVEDGNDAGPIVKINGDPKDNNATLFKEGSNEVFEEEGVEIAEEFDTPDWLPENAQREMEQAITSVGADEIKGVYAANDGTAGGAIAAMKANGMDPTEIPVTGQDAELTAVQRIIAGEQFMTVYKPIQPLAEAAAEMAVAVANGEEPSADLVTSETDNGTEAVPTAIIETIAVTTDNVADTIIADEVYPVDEICAGAVRQGVRGRGYRVVTRANTLDARGGDEKHERTTTSGGATALSSPPRAEGDVQELRRRRSHEGRRPGGPARRGAWASWATTAPASRP